MLSEELLAALTRSDATDVQPVLSILLQKHGRPAMRAATSDLFSSGGDRAEEDETPRMEALTVSELLRRIGTPPPMLVDRLIPEKSIILLTGKPKHSKSLAAIDLGVGVATGAPVWGAFAVSRPGVVLYIALEDGDIEVGNRYLAHGFRPIDADEAPHQNLRTVLWQHSLRDPIALMELMRLIEELQPVLIIIDTAREALRIKDWNDSGEISDGIRPLRQMARKHCSVLLVAHNRKAAADDSGDEIAGSNAFTSSVDGWLSITSKTDLPSGNRRLTLNIQGRGGMRGETCIEMDTHTLRFRCVDAEEVAGEKRDQAQQDREKRHDRLVRALLDLEDGKGTVHDLADALGQHYDATRKQVQDALADGALEDTGEKRPLPAGMRGPRPSVYRAASGLFGASGAAGNELSERRDIPIGRSGNSNSPPLLEAPDIVWSEPFDPKAGKVQAGVDGVLATRAVGWGADQQLALNDLETRAKRDTTLTPDEHDTIARAASLQRLRWLNPQHFDKASDSPAASGKQRVVV